ncbi:MAG: apolipoprotein N-acyltransferase [Betaproteobacteria bacterium]|nr:apolipoprotein N-acyltransferase [Betaproteobacteria bacterium]
MRLLAWVTVTLTSQLTLATLGGASTVLSFAPFNAWPVALLGLGILFILWFKAENRLRAALIGLCWGLGQFIAGVSWLYISLHEFGNMPGWMAAIAVLIFSTYLSLFPLLAGWVVQAVRHRALLSSAQQLLGLMPAAFCLLEWLRGWFLTGFPWLTLGYSQAPGWLPVPLAGYAPLVGVFGISWAIAISAGALVVLLHPALAPRRTRLFITAALVLLWGGGALLRLIPWSQPNGAPLSVALVQGNIEQHLKWREDQRIPSLQNYRELVEATRAKLIILPESALPGFLDQMPADYLQALKQRALQNGGDLLLGVPVAQRADPNQPVYTYYNSVISLGQSPTQGYAKDHLVIFGEYSPSWLSWIYQWLSIPFAGFTPGGTKQPPFNVAGHAVATNICYEDAYGDEVSRPMPAAELLVNVSNMAWYGRSLAADQHAQFSQMRAMENARWMLRATNTGVTAAIDETGRIVKALPQFTRGNLEIEAQPRRGMTPYMRWRDWPVIAGLLFTLIGIAWRHRRGKKSQP